MDTKLEQIAELIPCHRYEHYLAAKCVFHEDRNPSLMIYPDRYYCKSCGESGTTARLLRYLQTGNFHTAEYEVYHPNLWRKLGDFDPEDVALEAHYYLKKNWDRSYYLKQRGIDSLFSPLLIGFLDGYYTFPIFGGAHEIMGLVARAGPVLQEQTGIRYLIPPHQDPNLLYCPDWDKVLKEDYVLAPFGMVDAMTLHLIGYPVISPTTGHNLQPEAFKHLRKKIIFLPDGDHRDDRTARELASQLDWRGRVAFLDYPDCTKDANEIYCKYGARLLKDMIGDVLKQIPFHFSLRMEHINGESYPQIQTIH